ncbi:flagellar motor protein MotB [Bdellovibrionota bacterium FG-1]
MADKKASIIIKKIKRGGHAAAHGGAWKVAFADFMTAMMCFFLVMWLMGADEATKAAIAHYFNNPSSPEAWRPDMHDRDAIPLGNQTGAGDSVLRGANGEVPEDLVQHPQPIQERKPDSQGPLESEGTLSRDEIASAEAITFSIPEKDLFVPEKPELTMARAEIALKRIQKVARTFKGSLVIRSTYDDLNKSDYEFQNSRIIEIKRHMVEERWLSEDLISNSLSKGDTKNGRNYEFNFQK